MRSFQVKIWPNGNWDGNEHQNVDAKTAQEAAETIYGKPLKSAGSSHQLRVKVRDGVGLRGQETLFYEV